MEAQKIVQAATYYTLADNGLVQPWRGMVWLNGPWGNLPPWVRKLISEMKIGNVPAAIMLTHNNTSTAWFDMAMQEAASVCYPRGMIRFLDRNGMPLPNFSWAQMFIYFGNDVEKFEDEFSKIGLCMRLSRAYSNGE
jgi:hypothetical protein